MEEKEFIINTAKKAADYLMEKFKTDSEMIRQRGLSKEVVTKYDKESDKIIVSAIKENFPDHNIIAEESDRVDNGSEYTWVVDSCDGSGNFAVGNPFFSVEIALLKNDEPILGVINTPMLNELYIAEKGKGAFLNGKQINVSAVEDAKKAYVVTCEGSCQNNSDFLKLYQKVLPNVTDMRKLGSAANEGGFVASGRAEAYFTLGIDPWDVAAAVLIVEEAGGKVTDFNGNPWFPKRMDLLMSNGILHDEMLKILKDQVSG